MRTGLALSGGGALGAAHIGVLEVVEELGISIAMLSGTSSGALMGLLYADGGLRAIDTFLDDLEACGIVRDNGLPLMRPPDAIFTEVRQCLRRHVRATTFDALRLRFCCVATDLATGGMVLLRDGDPVAAVMASAAYPGVFPVQRVAGRVLTDGGAVRNLPSDVLAEAGMEFIIGSSLYGLAPLRLPDKKVPLSRIQVVLRTYDILQLGLSQLLMAHCHFCFTPPVETFRWYDFGRIEAIRELGRRYARERLPELLESYRTRGDTASADC